jgi:hypothetical protein
LDLAEGAANAEVDIGVGLLEVTKSMSRAIDASEIDLQKDPIASHDDLIRGVRRGVAQLFKGVRKGHIDYRQGIYKARRDARQMDDLVHQDLELGERE